MVNGPESTFLEGKRIIVYNDAKGFGGHEVMTLCAIRWLLSEGAILDCFYRPVNERWKAALNALKDKSPQLQLHEVTLPNIRFHQAYHFFHRSLVQEIAAQFKQRKPELVFVAQGNLEISAVGTLAARKADLPCISYIPIGHSFRELRSNRPLRRDIFNRYLAKIPTRWLTNGKAQAARLRERGANQEIDILPNLVEISNPNTPNEARRELGFAENDLVIGMCGRIDNNQKGCDIFIDALQQAPKTSMLRKARLLFIGDGPDWPTMKEKLSANGWGYSIKHVGWTNKPESYYSAFDLMVIPSRFEGLPIAMQEAILCGVPVAATAVDGMATFLPTHWTCQPENPVSLLQLIESYLADSEAYRAPLEKLKQKILREYSREAFEEALGHSISNLLRPGSM